MIFADQRSLFASFESLLYAFNDIESVLEDIIEEGHIIGEYTPEFPTYQRLSSDFITLYNECEYLTKNHRARLNNKDLTYLRLVPTVSEFRWTRQGFFLRHRMTFFL